MSNIEYPILNLKEFTWKFNVENSILNIIYPPGKCRKDKVFERAEGYNK